MTCTCPSWWNCPERGCYSEALISYADPKTKKNIGNDFEHIGPEYQGSDGKWHREQRLK